MFLSLIDARYLSITNIYTALSCVMLRLCLYLHMKNRLSIGFTDRQMKYLRLISKQSGNTMASLIRLVLNNEIERAMTANNISTNDRYLKDLADSHPLKTK